MLQMILNRLIGPVHVFSEPAADRVALSVSRWHDDEDDSYCEVSHGCLQSQIRVIYGLLSAAWPHELPSVAVGYEPYAMLLAFVVAPKLGSVVPAGRETAGRIRFADCRRYRRISSGSSETG